MYMQVHTFYFFHIFHNNKIVWSTFRRIAIKYITKLFLGRLLKTQQQQFVLYIFIYKLYVYIIINSCSCCFLRFFILVIVLQCVFFLQQLQLQLSKKGGWFWYTFYRTFPPSSCHAHGKQFLPWVIATTTTTSIAEKANETIEKSHCSHK